MKKANLLYHTLNGELTHVTVVPNIQKPDCSFRLEVLEEGERKALMLTFSEIAALEFSMNFCDNSSEEKTGFYKVPGTKQKRKLLERNFKRRKKEWVMTRLRDAEKTEEEMNPEDRKELDALEEKLMSSNLYLLESCGGAWLVLAKGYACTEV